MISFCPIDNMSGTRYSIMEYFGRDEEGHRCGYCDGATGSISHGMWAHLMSVGDYQGYFMH